MACCKACCGCADCEEGDQGKCCCGGAEGECCLEGEYCCDGVCQEGLCDEECLCPNKCGYELKASINELTTTSEAVLTPTDCESCNGSEEDVVDNPQDPGDQVAGGGINFVRTGVTNAPGFGSYAAGDMQFVETYVYVDGDVRREYGRSGSSYFLAYCSVVDGVAKWRVFGQCGYAESQVFYDTSTTPFTLTKDQGSGVSRFADVEVALESCCTPPDITITVDLDELVINGTSYPMLDIEASGPLVENCRELVDGVLEDCADYLADYPAATTYELTWTGDCPGPCDAPPP